MSRHDELDASIGNEFATVFYRFWYERTLTSRLQRKVERQTLARIIRRNTPVAGEIPDNVFRMP